MHPSVQPPAITKSVVLLLCLRQSDPDKRQLPALRLTTQGILSRSADWNREGRTSKAVRRQKWIRNEPNSEQRMIYRITSLNGALSKQRRNQRWGGASASASYFTSSIWTSCFIWKHEKVTKATDWGGHKCMENISCVVRTSGWGEQTRGIKWEESNIFTSVYVQI